MDLSEPVFLLSEDYMKAKMHCEKLVSEIVEQELQESYNKMSSVYSVHTNCSKYCETLRQVLKDAEKTGKVKCNEKCCHDWMSKYLHSAPNDMTIELHNEHCDRMLFIKSK